MGPKLPESQARGFSWPGYSVEKYGFLSMGLNTRALQIEHFVLPNL